MPSPKKKKRKKKKEKKKTKQLKEEWQVLHANQGLLNIKKKKKGIEQVSHTHT
jgi:hypothetical protein